MVQIGWTNGNCLSIPMILIMRTLRYLLTINTCILYRIVPVGMGARICGALSVEPIAVTVHRVIWDHESIPLVMSVILLLVRTTPCTLPVTDIWASVDWIFSKLSTRMAYGGTPQI